MKHNIDLLTHTFLNNRGFALVCCLLSSFLTSAQYSSEQQFDRVEVPQDFPNFTINTITRDLQGIIWIGTNDGVCRYDSPKNVKVFKANSVDYPSGLLSNTIERIIPDASGNLWIGTKLGGLTRYNQKENTWKTYKHIESDSTSLSNNDILSLLFDSQQRLWVGTENGLNLYVDSLDSFIKFLPDPEDDQSLNTKAVLSICEDNKGWIWLTTWEGGLHLLLPDLNGQIDKSKFKVILPSGDKSKQSMWSVFNDREGRYWVGSHVDGLALMQLPPEANNTLGRQDWQPHFHFYRSSVNNPKSLSNNFVTDIDQDDLGNLWIGTVHGLGVIENDKLPDCTIYNSVTSEKPPIDIVQNYFSPANNKSISSNFIKSIYKDQQGLIWIGTEVGLNIHNRQKNQFETDLIVYKDYPTLENEVMTLINDSIVMLNLGHGDIVFYNELIESVSTNIKFPKITDATSLVKDKESVYISRKSGISHMSLKDFQVTELDVPQWLKTILSKAIIKSIIKDSKDRLWLGSTIGLFLYDLNTKSAVAMYSDNTLPHSLTDSAVSDVFEDAFGNIWVGTYGGLNKLIGIDGDTYKFKQYLYDDSNPNESLPFNSLIDIEGFNGHLYIGSESGFFSLDIEKDRFVNITKNRPKYTIRSIQITESGHVWASTSDGIIVYYPESDSFIEFEESDGFTNSGFLRRSKTASEDGVLYFGGRTGYIKFNPEEFTQTDVNSQIYITEIHEMNRKGNNEYSLSYQDEISFPHDAYNISISFSSTNYARPKKNNFAYQLEGFTEGWIYIKETTPVVFTNLDPGHYTFRIKNSTSDGQWSKTEDSLSIIIKPAFWETWWFRLLVTCVGCTIIWFLFHLYTRNIKQVNEKLSRYNENLNKEIKERKKVEEALHERELYMEQLVDERTEELSAKNNKVKSLLSELEIRNNELEQVVKKRTAKLTQSNQELIRSNKDLEQFAYISSHDLKEPLRTVGTFTSLLNKKFEKTLDPRAKEYLGFISEGVWRMSELIQSLLSYSTVGNKNIELRIINLPNLVNDIIKDFAGIITEKNVTITVDYLPTIVCDKIQMGMVFRNLIANAIKFNDKKEPRIHIGMNEHRDDYWFFFVEDNGIGIEPKYQHQIFELFKRLHRKDEYEGTGIGLAMCQKIIIRHQGDLTVDSIKDKGSKFSFTISKELSSIDSQMDIYNNA